MRLLVLTTLLFLLAACQSTRTPPVYSDLVTRIGAGEEVAVTDLQAAFTLREDLTTVFPQLQALERQALAIMADEPLKLGAIGTTILDLYQGSLAGHMALEAFYSHVGSTDAAIPHTAWIKRIRAQIESASGTLESPYRVTGQSEATAHLTVQALDPVGGIYQSEPHAPLTLALLGKQTNGAIKTSFYSLDPMFRALTARFPPAEGEPEPKTLKGDEAAAAQANQALAMIGILARESDSAAQTSVGAFLAARRRTEDALGWLGAAARNGNLVANMLIAGIYRDQIKDAPDDKTREEYTSQIVDNYTHAISLGSADAMYSLGVLYLNGQFGKENVASGLPLLEQAAALEHSDSLTHLGTLHALGEHFPEDQAKAAEHFIRAAALGNPRATYAYARLLIAPENKLTLDGRVHDWLQTLADNEDAEAMVHLGNLHARGVGFAASGKLATKPKAGRDNRRAARWYKAAVKLNPDDPNIVNEVAWTLAVSDIEGLPQPRYAKTIMDRLMTQNEDASTRPEYLDTWAAIHAANGEFKQAIVLQEKALNRAKELKREDVYDILEEHLQKFRAGEVIVERAP
ncbi:MAG: sel1 repeat family protein [Gammaproteobacteria bacterium]|nr:sel1 repeat family protein [Gammaproteobacteria bacterium]